MAILDLIEFFDEDGDIIVAKIPHEGSGEFRLGSQLVVQEGQVGIFYRDGQALDKFGPGRYTLDTHNIPLLGKLIGAAFGGRSPFRSYVFFVATKTFTNLGWGTQSPVLFRDVEFRMISLRAHGAYSIKIADANKFLDEMVGTCGVETTFAVEEFLRSIIVSRLNEILGSVMKSILDLPILYNSMAQQIREAVRDDFARYGIQLVDIFVQAITPPPEVQEMINRASGVAAQDVEKYKAIAAADALRDAAKNPGGAAASGMGAGLGMAMGLGMAPHMADGLAASPPRDGDAGAQAKPTMAEIKAKLKDLKELQDEGLIEQADYEEQKKRLLSLM